MVADVPDSIFICAVISVYDEEGFGRELGYENESND